MKKLTSILILALMPLACVPAFDSDPSEDYVLQGYVKSKPLQVVSNDIIRTANALNLPQNQIFFAYLFFGLVGYPDFAGLSDVDNVAMFIYDKQDFSDPEVVFCAKIDPVSPVFEKIKELNWTTTEYKDWTFVSSQDPHVSLLKNKDDLLRILERPIGSEIEFGMLFSQLVKHIDRLEAKMDQEAFLKASDDQNRSPALAGQKFILEYLHSLAENCHGMTLGFTFEEENIKMAISVKANKGTPEGDFFSQVINPDYAIAQYLPKGEFFSAVGNDDPEASKAYWDYLFKRFSGVASDEDKVVIGAFQSLINETINRETGSFAFIEGVANNSEATVELSSTSKDNASLLEYHKGPYQNYLQKLSERIDFYTEINNDFKFDLKPNVASVGDTEIHLLSSTNTLPTPDIDPAAAASPLIVKFETESNEEYFSSVNNIDIYSDNLEDMEAIVKRIQNKQPAENNLASLFTPMANTYLQFQMDIYSFIKHLCAVHNNDSDPTFQKTTEAVCNLYTEIGDTLPPGGQEKA